jgi:AcrR family transcriptional regulator
MRPVGRPRLHDTEELLDAAAALAAEHGPAGLTMAGLAHANGAPSGSLYHRFASRAALLGEVWLRAVDRFQAGFLEALGREPALDACVAAAWHVIAWSRDHDVELRILLRGPGEFAADDWPAGLRGRAEATQSRLDDALRDAAGRLPDHRGDALERVVLATVDLPYAVARRHLRAGAGRIPARADALVRRSARAILEAG